MLPASLKDDTVKMNDRNKHKVMEQMKHQTADPKAKASVFLFFPTAHFLKTIFANAQMAHLVLPHRTKPTLQQNPKSQFPAHNQKAVVV
jgi:hypothetical protein